MKLPAHLLALNPHLARAHVRTARVRDATSLEEILARQIKNAELPNPHRNYRFAETIGRKSEMDFAWLKQRIGAEVNGGTWVKGGHSTGTGISRDYEKSNNALLLKWRLFVFDGAMVKDGRAIETLLKAFGR